MASILDASATKPAILILHECSWASLTYAFHAKVPTSSTTYTGGHPSQLHLISNQPTSSSKNVRGHLSHMSPTPSSPISCFANARGHLTDATHAILAKLRPPWASLVNASHSEAASLIFHECACASDACPTLPISSSTNVRGHVQQVHSIPTPSK
eukprot:CAMPEP_0114229252 /NCGR_PEP_ID=MMETSP0058-20121206/2804_1 /TAXON_ID=36894 /ORGANISM="Pyramimonas parkeae, CCMP726" /LENGTH=154 /DNA_ID=CAMNT_0001340307 /DNA_START=9116 /DNA_END=9577 /DNA_ORIENTATION=+